MTSRLILEHMRDQNSSCTQRFACRGEDFLSIHLRYSDVWIDFGRGGTRDSRTQNKQGLHLLRFLHPSTGYYHPIHLSNHRGGDFWSMSLLNGTRRGVGTSFLHFLLLQCTKNEVSLRGEGRHVAQRLLIKLGCDGSIQACRCLGTSSHRQSAKRPTLAVWVIGSLPHHIGAGIFIFLRMRQNFYGHSIERKGACLSLRAWAYLLSITQSPK